MMTSRCISSDTHVIEPPTLWAERIDSAHRHRAPTVVDRDGADWWHVDGARFLSFSGGVQTGVRFEAPERLRTGARFADVRTGAYVPDDHLADNAADGIAGSVLYPTAGLSFYRIPDSALFSAVCRAYNDWLAEFCAASPRRLKGVAMLNTDDPVDAAAELERARAIGLSGAMIPTATAEDARYDSPRYDRLWAAAEATATPLSLHLGAYRLHDPALARDTDDVRQTRRTFFVTVSGFVQTALADMIFSGVFDRFPGLRVGTVEHELGWIPHFLDRLDYTYTQRQDNAGYYHLQRCDLPSDAFRAHVFCSFQDDDLGIRERATIGVEGLMFGSDYPHSESTFPRSMAIMSERLREVPEAERELILCRNVARFYDFDL
jgi:predicted TIM-barrel fold metal-dependent hydrolase